MLAPQRPGAIRARSSYVYVQVCALAELSGSVITNFCGVPLAFHVQLPLHGFHGSGARIMAVLCHAIGVRIRGKTVVIGRIEGLFVVDYYPPYYLSDEISHAGWRGGLPTPGLCLGSGQEFLRGFREWIWRLLTKSTIRMSSVSARVFRV